ncbi:unnamed protein product [Blepharisma stoltei]|uniref:C2 domain-containing protein n=1 Tax=Blepharisma stoltei TaxID=1481888 RepID=A0AAU9IFB9_9CILI|nr:unnamed protein product [Blepharisma stoltei]
MDPYCVLKLGNFELQTVEHRGADKLPSWKEELTFNVLPGDDLLQITLWDKNTLSKDRKIGSASFPLFELFSKRFIEDWVELMFEGKSAGHIKLQMTFQPEWEQQKISEGERLEEKAELQKEQAQPEISGQRLKEYPAYQESGIRREEVKPELYNQEEFPQEKKIFSVEPGSEYQKEYPQESQYQQKQEIPIHERKGYSEELQQNVQYSKEFQQRQEIPSYERKGYTEELRHEKQPPQESQYQQKQEFPIHERKGYTEELGHTKKHQQEESQQHLQKEDFPKQERKVYSEEPRPEYVYKQYPQQGVPQQEKKLYKEEPLAKTWKYEEIEKPKEHDEKEEERREGIAQKGELKEFPKEPSKPEILKHTIEKETYIFSKQPKEEAERPIIQREKVYDQQLSKEQVQQLEAQQEKLYEQKPSHEIKLPAFQHEQMPAQESAQPIYQEKMHEEKPIKKEKKHKEKLPKEEKLHTGEKMSKEEKLHKKEKVPKEEKLHKVKVPKEEKVQKGEKIHKEKKAPKEEKEKKAHKKIPKEESQPEERERVEFQERQPRKEMEFQERQPKVAFKSHEVQPGQEMEYRKQPREEFQPHEAGYRKGMEFQEHPKEEIHREGMKYREQPKEQYKPQEVSSEEAHQPLYFQYGMIYIRPLSAKITRDVAAEIMDPYCVFRISDAERVSEESRSGDKNPIWNEQLPFFVGPGDFYLTVTLKDRKALQKDKIIGSAALPLFKLYADKLVEDWIELKYEGQSSGHIKVNMMFYPNEKPESIKEASATKEMSDQQTGEVKRDVFEGQQSAGLKKDIQEGVFREQKGPIKEGAVGEQYTGLKEKHQEKEIYQHSQKEKPKEHKTTQYEQKIL